MADDEVTYSKMADDEVTYSKMADDEVTYSKTLFTFMREVPFPTLYGENKTPVTEYVLETGWITAFCALAVTLYIIVPVQPKSWFVLLRATAALALGFIIMLCNFGYKWETGSLVTHTAYKPGSPTEIDAQIGVRFGLRGVNITLKAVSPPTADLENETINYNEEFSWMWSQGRPGFGPFASRLARDFRAHQRRGTPLPILWVAEYFTFDGEGIRLGRHYRLAGWYAHMCMWAALPAWLLTVILCNMVVSYGAAMLCLTGGCLTTAALLWAFVRNHIELAVPFDHGILTTKFGDHWYLALLIGIQCIVCGACLFALSMVNHDKACWVMGINPVAYLEEEYEESNGLDNKAQSTDIEMAAFSEEPPQSPLPASLAVRYRSRGTSKRNWKTHQILPPPPPLGPLLQASEQLLYEPLASDSGLPPPPAGAYPQINVTKQPATPSSDDQEEPLYVNDPAVGQASQSRLPFENVPLHPAPRPPALHRR